MLTPRGELREKRYRNGYAGARYSAQKQIDEWITAITECIEIDGLPECLIIQENENNKTTNTEY